MYGKKHWNYVAKWVYGSEKDKNDMIDSLAQRIVSDNPKIPQETAQFLSKEVFENHGCDDAYHVMEGFKFLIISETEFSIGEGTMIKKVFTVGVPTRIDLDKILNTRKPI